MILEKCLSLTIVMVYLKSIGVNADIATEEMTSIMKAINPEVMECAKEYDDVSIEKLLVDLKKDDSNLFYCFVGCVLKKLKILDSKTMLNTEPLLALLTTHLKDKEEIEDFKKVANTCSKVTEKEASEEVDVCKQTKKLFQCVHENDPEKIEGQ